MKITTQTDQYVFMILSLMWNISRLESFNQFEFLIARFAL